MNFVRIPELIPSTPYLAQMSLQDKIALHMYGNNLTVWLELQTLKTFLETGGGGTLPGVSSGGEIIYVVPVEDEDEDTYVNSSLAGKDFNLTLEGRPLIKQIYDASGNPTVTGAEYEVLSAGGFHRLDGDKFIPGQRYKLAMHQSGATTPTGTSSAFFTGVFQADTNTPLDASHENKLIQIRNNSTITLQDISTAPLYSVVVIEATINNTGQPLVKTRPGQYIYMNNGSYGGILVGIGESVWLFRKADGYYVINDFGKIYQDVGQVKIAFKAGFNELALDGSLISRTAFPRLWDYVQTLAVSGSLIEENLWQTPSVTNGSGETIYRPFRGCFSRGDGTTNFRVPDWRNMGVRGIMGNTDPQRYHNAAGGFQPGGVEQHNHVMSPFNKASARASEAGNYMTPGSTDSVNTETEYRVGGMALSDWQNAEIKTYGGYETRMDNIGVQWVIKA